MTLHAAIAGGGLTGCLAALDIAERGHHATIFEAAGDLMTRASQANEGKIHLGYVYAADTSFHTAERLIDDALLFRPLLERWMTKAEFEACLYDRFIYAVPPDSALGQDVITAHFTRVEARIQLRMRELGAGYLGAEGFEDFRPAEDEAGNGMPCFHTEERGVWPLGIAAAVARAVRAHPRIALRLGTPVDNIVADGSGWRINCHGSADGEGPFDIAINAAWAGRRGIDGRSGFTTPGSWFTRYKFGVVLEQATRLFGDDMPRNITATSGRFGDCVHYRPDDTFYCSWYPVGMCLSTLDEPGAPPVFTMAQAEEMMRRTWDGFARFAPALGRLARLPSPLPATLRGDFIIAKAQSDIDDPASGLHLRSDHGPLRRAAGYWSVESGKYTSAPRCAAACVEASLAER